MKYVRFGDLNVDVSINGFAIKLENYVASVPHFVRQGKVMTWKRLVRKFEKHLVWNITKSTASSMMGRGPATLATQVDDTDDLNAPLSPSAESDEMAAKSRLLFGGPQAEKKIMGAKKGTGRHSAMSM